MIIRTFIILAILLAIDLYIFNGTKVLTRNATPTTSRLVFYLYWSVTLICFTIITAGLVIDWHTWPKAIRTYSFAFVFVTYFSKLFLILFLIVDDLFRLFRWVISLFDKSGDDITTGYETDGAASLSRSGFIVRLGVIIAAIPFAALIVGMIRGKYEYQVRKVMLK